MPIKDPFREVSLLKISSLPFCVPGRFMARCRVHRDHVSATSIAKIKISAKNQWSSIMSLFLWNFLCFYTSSSSDLSLASSSSSSPSVSQPAASRLDDRTPKLRAKPMNAMPPNKPKAKTSPFGCTLVAREKRPPDTKGPTARPAAERVCASPFNVPRTLWFGAEFVIYQPS